MAINSTSGGSATVQITSWAYNEASANSQSQANGVDEVVFANDIASVNNGNLQASPTFSGRFVVKNRGLSDEEVRYITSQTAGTGSSIIGTVSEPWSDQPIGTDTLEVCYIVQDAATVAGVGLVNKTNDDYDFSKFFEVQAGAGFGLLDGATMITDSNGSTTTAEITALSGAWFQVGVKQFGTGVRGGRISLSAGTGPADGDWGIDIQDGAIGNFYSVDIKGGVSYNSQFNGTVEILDSKLFKCIYDSDFTGVITLDNVVIEGTNLSTDTMTVDASTDVQSMVYGQANGFTDDATATTETITLQDVDWSGLSLHINVQNANKTYVVLDPFNWNPVTGSQTELSFSAAGLIEWRNSIEGTARQPDATAISGTKVFITEHDITDTVVYEALSDVNGAFSNDVLYESYEDNAGTSVTVTTYGGWGTKAYKYAKTPFDTVIDYTQRAITQQFSLVDDPDITAPSRDDALFSGSGITVEYHGSGTIFVGADTRPMKVMRVDGITTAPTYGDVIDDNATSTKSGTVIDFVDRGSGVYDIVLEYWTGVEFADNDVLDLNGAAWDAGAVQADTVGFYQEVTWWMGEEGQSNTTKVIYDNQVAQLSTTASIGTEWEQIVIAGDTTFAIPFQGNGSQVFNSEYNPTTTEGWWIGRVSDLQNISYFTMDDGTQWTPPAQVTHTTSGLISGSIVRYISGTGAGATILYEETAGVTGEVNYNYTWESDIDITILILSLEYENEDRDITLTNSNAELIIDQDTDIAYRNP